MTNQDKAAYVWVARVAIVEEERIVVEQKTTVDSQEHVAVFPAKLNALSRATNMLGGDGDWADNDPLGVTELDIRSKSQRLQLPGVV